jgi:nucleotide-binding universal stress UspA family protein
MYKTILLAYNGSQEGQDALTNTKELARWSASRVWLVAVRPGFDPVAFAGGGIYNPAWDESENARFKKILDEGLQKLGDAGFEVSGQILQGDPVMEISKFATGIAADLIVVGHRHLDNRVARWWSGSISSALVEEAPCSVFCVIGNKA